MGREHLIILQPGRSARQTDDNKTNKRARVTALGVILPGQIEHKCETLTSSQFLYVAVLRHVFPFLIGVTLPVEH